MKSLIISATRHCGGALLAVSLTAGGVAAADPTPVAAEAASATINQGELECLAKAVYFEARGEPVAGQRAVAEVILNRVDSRRFPGTVCGVVTQSSSKGCQFSYQCSGRSLAIREKAAYDRAHHIATNALSGAPRDLTDGATYFHTRSVNPSWARRFMRTAQIGHHIFYRQGERVALQ